MQGEKIQNSILTFLQDEDPAWKAFLSAGQAAARWQLYHWNKSHQGKTHPHFLNPKKTDLHLV